MDYHQPVLLKEVLETLDPQPGKTFIDATLGNGGHTLALLQAGATVYGVEQDPTNLAIAAKRIQEANLVDHFFPINKNFSELGSIISTLDCHLDGILFDLGLSSNQQKSDSRGFSFNDSQSIDMRLDPDSQPQSAEEVINTFSYQQLYDIFTKIGQETYAKPIIIRIIEERQKSPIKSGTRLANIVREYYQQKHTRTSIDPATKIFMALRIYVNHEFENIKTAMEATLNSPQTKVAIISFHSGEDRFVKQFIRQQSMASKISTISLKPILPSATEIQTNPLSRSAVLRSYKIN